MPRLRPFYTEFFYSPLTEDVEELLARFQQTDSVRYVDFSAVWREMAFSDVFLGLPRMSERKGFSRVALATAVKYFLPPNSYQIRVGGLYLMFGFYHTQHSIPPVQIRLALRDWASVRKFLDDSLHCGHYDVIYIYHKLVATKAIHYTAMPHFLTFHKQRKPTNEPVCLEFIGRTTAVQELISSDFLEELGNLESQYDKLKETTVEVGSKVAMTQRDFAARLQNCASEFLTWQQKTFSQDQKDENSGGGGGDDDYDDDGDDVDEKQAEAKSSSSRAKLLSSIKQRSYRNVQEAPKSRRHRPVQMAESSSSGAEQEHGPRRKRPLSLRARTWRSLGVTPNENKAQAWLLSAPERQEKSPVKRTNQVALNP